MRRLAFCALAVCLAGCPEETGEGLGDLVVVFQDGSSDEAFLAVYDRAEQGDVTVDDSRSSSLVVPAAGTVLTPNTVPTFGWGNPGKRPHGVASGTFVWLELSGAGLAAPLHVFSLGTQTFTPTASQWADISDKLGTLTVRITTATCDDAVVREGPFRPAGSTTFTIAVN
jgi:hypothetical protein